MDEDIKEIPMKNIYIFLYAIFSLLLLSCASTPTQQCPPDTQNLPDCPPAQAINDEAINTLYKNRTWMPASKLTKDPIKMGADAQIPINLARVKVIGPKYDEALSSLAVKLWLIENVQHTVGVVSELYYTLLYLHKGNMRLTPMKDDEYEDFEHYKKLYQQERDISQQHDGELQNGYKCAKNCWNLRVKRPA